MPICKNPECQKEFNPNNEFSRNQKCCSKKCYNRYYFLLHQKEWSTRYRHKSKWNPKLHPLGYERLNSKLKYLPPEIEAKLKALAEKQQDLNGFLKLKPNCDVCGSAQCLILHHIKYSPLEVVTLCASCHSILHLRFLRERRVKPRVEKFYPLAIWKSSTLGLI